MTEDTAQDTQRDNEGIACPDCGHRHTDHECTGDPTPSDLWAGVSPAVCDCAHPVPADHGTDRADEEGDDRG